MNDVSEVFVAEARSLLAANYLPKIERCVEKLSDEEIWARPAGGEEANSIGNLLLHLAGNARQWIVSGVGGSPDHRARQKEFETCSGISRAELLAQLRGTLDEVDEVLARIDPSIILERREIQGRAVTVLGAVLHVVEHFSMHTGQIILITKLLTKRDLGFYDFSGGAPVEAWHEPRP